MKNGTVKGLTSGRRYVFFLILMAMLLTIAGCGRGKDGAITVKSSIPGIQYKYYGESLNKKELQAVAEEADSFFKYVCDASDTDTLIIYDAGTAAEERTAPGFCIDENGHVNRADCEAFCTDYLSIIDSGMLYGLMNTAGIEVTPDDLELKEFYENEDNQYVLDLVLPVFENKLVDESVNAVARKTSDCLLKYLEVNHESDLKDILRASFDDEIKVNAKNEWLESLGITYRYEPVAPLLFVPNDNIYVLSYPYYIEGKHFKFYLKKADLDEWGYAYNCKRLYDKFDLIDADIEDVMTLMDYTESDDEKVDIYTDFYRYYKLKATVTDAQYNKLTERMLINSGWKVGMGSIAHEYIHRIEFKRGEALLLNFFMDGFMEAYTEERAVFEFKNRLKDQMFEEIINSPEEAKSALLDGTEKADTITYNYYYAWLWYAGLRDYFYTVTGKKVDAGTGPRDLTQMSYDAGANFIHYLIETKGRDAVVSTRYDEEAFYEMIGDYDKVYEEWGEHIKDYLKNHPVKGLDYKLD